MASNFDDFNRNLVQDVRSNGRPTSGPFLGREVLVLTTRGARSGATRETPLVFRAEGDDLVVVASKGGAPSHPSWYHNLVANPDVVVEFGHRRIPARARVVEDEAEYERLYSAHVQMAPTFAEYRRKTSRRIPVVVLEPAGPPEAGEGAGPEAQVQG